MGEMKKEQTCSDRLEIDPLDCAGCGGGREGKVINTFGSTKFQWYKDGL